MMRTRLIVLQAVTLVSVMLTGTAGAQTIDLRQFYTLSTPGARANGMGRAFTGIADDASAAVTNPAGLVLLTRPQVYGEFKSNFFDQTDTFGDTIESLRGRLSFFAVSAPIGDRVAVAFSRHEFFGADIDKDLGIRGTSYSGSIAATVQPKLKVGVTISGSTLRFLDNTDGEEFDSDSAVGVTVGALYQVNELLSVGVSGAKWSGSGSSDTFVAPSHFSVGVGITPIPELKLAFDVVRVGFPEDFAEDNVEVHAGAEYQLMPVGQNRIFLRAGAYSSKQADDLNFTQETKTTGTFGAGVVVGQRLQVDVAALTRKEVIVSAAWRF